MLIIVSVIPDYFNCGFEVDNDMNWTESHSHILNEGTTVFLLTKYIYKSKL